MSHPLITYPLALRSERRTRRAGRSTSIKRLVQTIASFVVAAGFLFLVISAPAQWERLKFSIGQGLNVASHEISQLLNLNDFSPAGFLAHVPDSTAVNGSVDIHSRVEIAENELALPSIGVKAPVLWNVPLDDSLNGLQQGVVQAEESVVPGEAGRTFVVGHSAGYWWQNNPWTKVFSLLDQVEPGDSVFIARDGQVYEYTVTREEVVKPSDVHVVRDETLTTNQLVLMTCTPVGTTLNRLIVIADPVATHNL